MSLPSNVYESIHRAWMGDTLEGLKDFIRIPAKSRAFNPNWESDGILKRTLEDSAEWGRRLLPCAEFEIIEKPGIPPALFIRIPTAGGHKGKPAFFYGHLDKQPETEGWSEGLGPWTPVVRDGRLYGRGGVDDGYNYYLTLTAVKALEEAGAAIPKSSASSRRTRNPAPVIWPGTFRNLRRASATPPSSPSPTSAATT